jgi:hypothetical protein
MENASQLQQGLPQPSGSTLKPFEQAVVPTQPAPDFIHRQISFPYTLPSRGILYGGALPGGECIIIPIRGQQQEILAGMGENANTTAVLRHIIQQLVVFPPTFKYYDLLFTDWLALLLNIMAISYTPTIPLKPRCPYCKEFSIYEIEIGKLECRTADDIPDKSNYLEPFTIGPLPLYKDVIKARMLRLVDYQKAEDFSNKIRQRIQLSPNNSERLERDETPTYITALQVVSINNYEKLPELKVMEWVKNCIKGDLDYFNNSIEDLETGYNMKPAFNCKRCGAIFEVQLPIDGSFFRGRQSRSRVIT